MVSMNRLSTEKRAQIIGCLTEGMSIRSTVRITGASKNTITKLLVDLGDACSAYQHATLRDLTCTTFECDEIWNFVYAKDKNIPTPRQGEHGIGSVWTWTAICADTKLIPAWFVGQRTAVDGYLFMMDLRTRLKYRPLTNAFSKKIENLAAAVALHYQVYNFARPHMSLKNPYPRTPAMAAEKADHVWTLQEVAALLD
jgi:hypothetical protein